MNCREYEHGKVASGLNKQAKQSKNLEMSQISCSMHTLIFVLVQANQNYFEAVGEK